MATHYAFLKRLSPFRLALLVLLPFLLNGLYSAVAHLVYSGLGLSWGDWQWAVMLTYQTLVFWIFLFAWWPLLAPQRRPVVVRFCWLATLGQAVFFLPAVLEYLYLPGLSGGTAVEIGLSALLTAAQPLIGGTVALGIAWLGMPRGGDRTPTRTPCPQCGYDLRGQTECRCPECGATFTLGDIAEQAD